MTHLGLDSQSEKHLLNTWNAKPVMSRPTHRFYREKNYLEVDLDIHLWRYLTRKFLLNAPQRFHLLVRSSPAQLEHGLANFRIRYCTQQGGGCCVT